MAMWN